MRIKFLRAFFCLFVILCLAASSVVFATEAPQEGSIRFVLSAKGEPIKNGSLMVYQIGVYSGNGTFSWNEDFSACGVSYSELGGKEAPQKLAETAKDLKNNVWTVFPDGSGEVVMDHVESGLYLVMQGEEFDGFTQTVPFIISVPSWESGSPNYTVTANPKISTVPVPPPEKPPELPKTGQLNWPIPILLVSGLAFILLGIVLFRKKRNET